VLQMFLVDLGQLHCNRGQEALTTSLLLHRLLTLSTIHLKCATSCDKIQ